MVDIIRFFFFKSQFQPLKFIALGACNTQGISYLNPPLTNELYNKINK